MGAALASKRLRRREPNGRLQRYNQSLKKTDLLYGFGVPSAAIYVITAGEAVVKIGVSTNPAARATTLQGAQEKPVRIWWAIRLPRDDARKIEKSIHRKLREKEFHAIGEWYYLSPAFARNIIEEEIKEHGARSTVDLSFGWGR